MQSIYHSNFLPRSNITLPKVVCRRGDACQDAVDLLQLQTRSPSLEKEHLRRIRPDFFGSIFESRLLVGKLVVLMGWTVQSWTFDQKIMSISMLIALE